MLLKLRKIYVFDGKDRLINMFKINLLFFSCIDSLINLLNFADDLLLNRSAIQQNSVFSSAEICEKKISDIRGRLPENFNV